MQIAQAVYDEITVWCSLIDDDALRGLSRSVCTLNRNSLVLILMTDHICWYILTAAGVVGRVFCSQFWVP